MVYLASTEIKMVNREFDFAVIYNCKLTYVKIKK